jgi:hypothetical protein
MSYDYKTTDTIGRDVEVEKHIFLTTTTTIDGGGNRTSSTTLFP